MTDSFHVAVFDGDGIGPEITAPAISVLDGAMARTGGVVATYEHLPAGARAYRDEGAALPARSLERARQADAILFSAMGGEHTRPAAADQ